MIGIENPDQQGGTLINVVNETQASENYQKSINIIDLRLSPVLN